MGAFVLAAAGRVDGGGRIEATQVFEKLMLLLLSEGFWPHGVQGLANGGLQPNDVVLLCLADGAERQVVGDAVVAAGSTPLTSQRLGQVRMYLGPQLPPDPLAFTHSVVLTQVNLREHPIRCTAEGDAPCAEVAGVLGGRVATGVVRPVGRATFEGLTGRSVPEAPREQAPQPPAPEPQTPAPHVDDARAFVLRNLRLVDFGERLGPPLREAVATPAGVIDLVCESEDAREIVAVMWANGEPPLEVLSAAHERLAWLRYDLGDDRRPLRGLILTLDGGGELAAGGDPRLAVRQVRIRCEAPPQSNPPVGRDRPPAAPSPPPPPSEPLGELRRLVHDGTPTAPGPDFAAKCLSVPRMRR